MEIENLLPVKNRQELRKWLEENSTTEKFCWVVVSAKEQPGVVQYLDAVEEALCLAGLTAQKRRYPIRIRLSVYPRERKTVISQS